ncbi:MAG: hypothetical protein ABSB74_12400 [Tepidisphaeraceae bacterium]
MAYGAARRTGIGVFSQAVLEVKGALCEKTIRTALDQILGRIPLLHGQMARDWRNLAPYWKVPSSARDSAIPLRVVDLPAHESGRAEQLFADHGNAPFDADWRHARFLLVRIGQERSRLGVVFDHRLLDAFAAETFFRLIDLTWQGRLDEIAPRLKQTEPAHADNWMRRFKSGQTLNRLFLQMKTLNVCFLTMPAGNAFRPNRFVHDGLTPEESAGFIRKAGEEIGVPILSPSAMARAILAVRQVLGSMSTTGTDYMVFTTANLRVPGQEWETFLFNHIVLLPFWLPAEGDATAKDAAIELRDQLFDHMKKQVPFALSDASALGRIVPHFIAGPMLLTMAGGRICSFYFACLRDAGFSGETFLGLPTVNLIHKPLALSPPGLNICMTHFRGRFNIVVSYVEGAMDDRTAKRLMEQFKSSLLR